ncbi:MAG: MetQ/NlpA family ABC transporter substrate-binding protein [Erysipelotrichaceae bacterium]|nr:MetQ/NlpA family ABC transporter substrate-binding protein [Erysipelotrichaceae bacterium]
MKFIRNQNDEQIQSFEFVHHFSVNQEWILILAAVINGNYVIEAGLNPAEDGLIVEGAESPYANIVAVREGSENDEAIAALIAALQSDKVKAYIEETYKGSVVPAFCVKKQHFKRVFKCAQSAVNL